MDFAIYSTYVGIYMYIYACIAYMYVCMCIVHHIRDTLVMSCIEIPVNFSALFTLVVNVLEAVCG